MPEPLDLAPLFEPFWIKRLTLPDRFVLPGMQRQRCEDGQQPPKLGDDYRRFVPGGIKSEPHQAGSA